MTDSTDEQLQRKRKTNYQAVSEANNFEGLDRSQGKPLPTEVINPDAVQEHQPTLVDLPDDYRFYLPTKDGRIHLNCSIRHQNGLRLWWGEFLATVLNEAVLSTVGKENASVGRFYMTPNARKVDIAVQIKGGPDLVYCFQRRTPQMARDWLDVPPFLRLRMSQVSEAWEESNLPVIPIYLLATEHFGGGLPIDRTFTVEVDKNTKGIVVDVMDGSYHVYTVQALVAALGEETARTSDGRLILELGAESAGCIWQGGGTSYSGTHIKPLAPILISHW